MHSSDIKNLNNAHGSSKTSTVVFGINGANTVKVTDFRLFHLPVQFKGIQKSLVKMKHMTNSSKSRCHTSKGKLLSSYTNMTYEVSKWGDFTKFGC